MAPENIPAHPSNTLGTNRKDAWWLEPTIMIVFLGAFLAYSMFRVFEMTSMSLAETSAGAYHYRSPLVSVDLTGFFSTGMVDKIPYLAYPALLVLPFPAGFRFTCYYFRRAYYRSFVARPAACATEAWTGPGYKGEKGILIFQNLHRYFLYATLILFVFHLVDAFKSMFPHGHFYFGLGNLLLWIDVILLGGYVLGCHAFRHLVGGRLDCFSCTSLAKTQHGIWKNVTILNQKHMFFALASIVSIVAADLYIRHLIQTGATTMWGLPA